jgi:hypothetical protein
VSTSRAVTRTLLPAFLTLPSMMEPTPSPRAVSETDFAIPHTWDTEVLGDDPELTDLWDRGYRLFRHPICKVGIGWVGLLLENGSTAILVLGGARISEANCRFLRP